MTFNNPGDNEIAQLLTSARSIAMVGLSDNPTRPSYEVAHVLRGFGYEIIPVSPTLTEWEGIPAMPSLEAAIDAGKQIDIVDVFRQPQHVDEIVESCLRLKLPVLWLQLGVINEAAALRAQTAGMIVVMNKCLKVERQRMALEQGTKKYRP